MSDDGSALVPSTLRVDSTVFPCQNKGNKSQYRDRKSLEDLYFSGGCEKNSKERSVYVAVL